MGWFRKKEDPLNSERYKGKPLLILLENYVLDCIGCFPKEKGPRVVEIVKRVYGGDEDWKKTLRSALHLDDTLDEDVRKIWRHNQDIAKRANEVLLPVDFARMFVDENFSSLID
jgi:hypothetical protein